jgi:hypothetical protein
MCAKIKCLANRDSFSSMVLSPDNRRGTEKPSLGVLFQILIPTVRRRIRNNDLEPRNGHNRVVFPFSRTSSSLSWLVLVLAYSTGIVK